MGGECGEKHGRHILTEQEVFEIRASKGITIRDLAERYGVSYTAVRYAKVGLTWKHLPMPPYDTVRS